MYTIITCIDKTYVMCVVSILCIFLYIPICVIYRHSNNDINNLAAFICYIITILYPTPFIWKYGMLFGGSTVYSPNVMTK